jgi:hypothetical protein
MLKQKTEELKRELDQINTRIAEGEGKQSRLAKRLSDAEARLTSLDGQAKELRARRQVALADGDNVEEITAEIEGLKHDRELIEDEITGLRGKLAHFSAEPHLRVKKSELERMILKTTLILPVVVNYNRLARKMAKTLADLDEALLELAKIQAPGQPLDSGTQDFSREQMPATISLLGLVGEPVPALIFDRAALIRKRNAVSSITSSQRAMEARFGGCICFGCASYRGLRINDPSQLLGCSAHNGAIPPEILTGKEECKDRPDQPGQSHSAFQKL